MGKAKADRTVQLRRAQVDYLTREQVQNNIEQHRFRQLISQGLIVEAGPVPKVPKPPRGPGLTKS